MKKINLSQSAKKMASSKSSKPVLPLRNTTKSWTLYQDLRLPLDIFLDCLFDKDYSRLILSGKPEKEDVQEAWNAIFLQYYDMVGASDSPLVEKTKEIQILNAKITFVHGAVQFLSLTYDQKIVNMLNHFGMQCNLIQGEDPFKKLNRTISMAKRFIVQMEEEQKELELMQSAEVKESSRGDFDDALMAVSKFQGYGVREKEITVSQYMKVMKKMNDYYQAQMNKYGH